MNNNKSIFKKIKSLGDKTHKQKITELINSMGISERIIFSLIIVIFGISSLSLLKNLNDFISTEIPVSGGTIREGVVGYPRYINPLLPVTDSGRDLSSLLYSGLMKGNIDGSVVPDLAKEYSISEDGLNYTFVLKDNIYFHDNTPITAYDVEFTVKKATDPIIKSPKAPNWEGVQVSVKDDKTIEFSLKKPYAPFIENLTLGILPKHIWKDVDSDAFPFSNYNFEPIGSGPFKIKEIKRNSAGLPEYYHLIPFNNYPNNPPFIENLLIFFFTSEEKLMEAYESGVIESMSSIAPENILKIDTDKSEIIRTSLPRIYGLFLNQNELSILANPTIREALDLATPKKQIINDVLKGFGTLIESPLPAYLSKNEPRSITDEESLNKAVELLKKAGFEKNESGILSKKEKDGVKTISLSISLPDVPELKTTATLIKNSWEKIGIKTDIKIFDLSDLNQNVIKPRKYDVLLFGQVIGRNLDLFAFWHSSERNDPGLNIANYTNAKVDKLLSDARSTSDFEKRVKIYQNVESELKKDVSAVFLYSPDLVYIVPKKLKGISISGITSASERLLHANEWFINTEKVWPLFK